MFLNINDKSIIEHTAKLESLHKSAFPVAVRSTLNDAAFDMKTKRLPAVFDKNFIIRSRTFLRSHTGVRKSPNTFDVRAMRSEVGIIRGKSDSGDELAKQERGGVIDNRDYIPRPGARVSKSEAKKITSKQLLKNIQPKRAVKVKRKKDYVEGAFKAGKKGFIKYNNYLIQINNIRKTKAGLKITTAIRYSFKKGRSVKIKKSPFMLPAALMTQRRIPHMYIINAKRRYLKYIK
jgi:hypothetical protein